MQEEVTTRTFLQPWAGWAQHGRRDLLLSSPLEFLASN